MRILSLFVFIFISINAFSQVNQEVNNSDLVKSICSRETFGIKGLNADIYARARISLYKMVSSILKEKSSLGFFRKSFSSETQRTLDDPTRAGLAGIDNTLEICIDISFADAKH